MTTQIEQFIERIFPSQDVEQLTAGDKAKAKAQDPNAAMDAKETIILISAVLFVLVFVGGLMVGHMGIVARTKILSLTMGQIGAAWFMGAKYDGVAEKLSLSKVFQSNTPQAGGPPVVGHQEL